MPIATRAYDVSDRITTVRYPSGPPFGSGKYTAVNVRILTRLSTFVKPQVDNLWIK